MGGKTRVVVNAKVVPESVQHCHITLRKAVCYLASNTNLAIMSSVVHLGSHPPLLALVIRPGGDESRTLGTILAMGHYKIGLPISLRQITGYPSLS